MKLRNVHKTRSKKDGNSLCNNKIILDKKMILRFGSLANDFKYKYVREKVASYAVKNCHYFYNFITFYHIDRIYDLRNFLYLHVNLHLEPSWQLLLSK